MAQTKSAFSGLMGFIIHLEKEQCHTRKSKRWDAVNAPGSALEHGLQVEERVKSGTAVGMEGFWRKGHLTVLERWRAVEKNKERKDRDENYTQLGK